MLNYLLCYIYGCFFVANFNFNDLVNILIDFLNNTRHRIKLNGQISAWASVDAGVPQGSILGPLLLFIDFNYLSDNLSSNVKLFADATFMVAFL